MTAAMSVHAQSRILGVGILVSILFLSAESLCSQAALQSRSFSEETTGSYAAGEHDQFELIHWSHPQSPFYVPGRSLVQKSEYAVQSSRDRATFLSRKMAAGGLLAAASSTVTLVSPLTTDPGYWEYAMKIAIGTPPKTLTAIVDTGSGLPWVQCSPCPGCHGQPDPLFDPTKSSTYKKMSCNDPLCTLGRQISCSNSTCQYDYLYGALGSKNLREAKGDLSYETLTIATVTGKSTKRIDFAFGCGHNDSGDFAHLDGIVGLGNDSLSFASQLSSQLLQAGSPYVSNKFSYCLMSYQDSSHKTSPLFFGDSAIPKVATQYTPILHNTREVSHYFIGLKGIKVDGVELNIPEGTFDIPSDGYGGVLSDSGTTFTSLVDAAYSPLLSRMRSLIKYPIAQNISSLSLDLCYDLCGVPSPTAFPQVTMVFDGFSLDLPQENSFMMVDDGTVNTACLAFQSAEVLNVFGNFQQQNFQILYDLEAKRFGFAKVQCDTLGAR